MVKWWASHPLVRTDGVLWMEATMTREQEVIHGKVGLLELARQLGSVNQACKVMGYSRRSGDRQITSFKPPDSVRRR
jgi:molybdenum-dependent DNA-binding transcriptional regulator ModE